MGHRRQGLHRRRASRTGASPRIGRKGAIAVTAGRPREAGTAREAIVSAADTLFYRHGVTAVSLEAIAARAGVTRRTLYYHFASKDVLVAAYLKRRDVSGRALLEASGWPGDGAGRRVLAVFETLERWFRTREFRGCALTNAVGEQVVIAGPVTLRHKRALLEWFVRTCASEAPGSSAELGEQLLLLFDGALSSARTRRDPEVARHARSAAATLLAAHGIKI